MSEKEWEAGGDSRQQSGTGFQRLEWVLFRCVHAHRPHPSTTGCCSCLSEKGPSFVQRFALIHSVCSNMDSIRTRIIYILIVRFDG